MGFSKQYEGVSETYKEPNQTSKMEHFVKIVEGWNLWNISAETLSYMSDYSLDTSISLVLNDVWVDEEPISLILMKNQQKSKPCWMVQMCKCGAMDRNVESLCCVWDWVWDTVIWMQSLR